MRRCWFVALLLAACSDSASTSTRPATDGGATGDAAAGDGGTSQDQDVGPTYCATLDPQPFLCVDFDDGAVPADVFTKSEGAGATVEEKGLRVQSDGATDAYVEHEADPSPQWSIVELGFSLRIDAQGSDARTIIARIGQHTTDTECRVELELSPSGLTLKGGTSDAKLTKTVTGSAARIVLSQEAATDGGKLRANVTVDGQPAIDAPIELACAAFTGPPRVTLGRISGAGSSDLRFDDVVFDGR